MKIIVYIIFISIALLLLPAASIAQKFSISLGVEYADYQMKDMRDYQKDLLKGFPVPAKSVHEFPAWWGYMGRFYYSKGRVQFGLNVGLNSTGARISYEDYSGSILIEQLARIVRIGAGCDYRLSRGNGTWTTWGSLQIERGFAKYNLQSQLILGGESLAEDKLDFLSGHILIHPAITVKRNFGSALFAAAHVGYLIDGGAALKYSKDRSLFLLDSDRDALGLQWSGFRLGISGGVKF